MDKLLTSKQERYVQELFLGKSQRQAYIIAFDTSNMKDETIDVKACNLAKDDKVRVRLAELYREQKEKTIWTKEQSLKVLVGMLDDNEKYKFRKDSDGKIVSVDAALQRNNTVVLQELNKMYGHYEAEKIAVGVDNPAKAFADFTATLKGGKNE